MNSLNKKKKKKKSVYKHVHEFINSTTSGSDPVNFETDHAWFNKTLLSEIMWFAKCKTISKPLIWNKDLLIFQSFMNLCFIASLHPFECVKISPTEKWLKYALDLYGWDVNGHCMHSTTAVLFSRMFPLGVQRLSKKISFHDNIMKSHCRGHIQ